MAATDTEEFGSLPISLVAHVAFCARRLWLEAAGERTPSVAIEEGIAAHAAVDERRDERVNRRRSVEVCSQVLGVHGRCDVLDVGRDGGLRVVEFKSAPLRRSNAVTPQQRMQLALQGLALKEAGHQVVGYGVFVTTTRQMVVVDLTDEDVGLARSAVVEARRIVEGKAAPEPLVDDPRCDRCSHAGVCLPEERLGRRVRRVHASDPDGEVLHLSTPGSRARLSRGRVEVVQGADVLGSVPIDRVHGLVVHGNVDVSSALIRELLWRRVSIVWASGRGRAVGFAQSTDSPNGLIRVSQHVASAEGRIDVARELVSSKLANQATLLRRSGAARGDVATDVVTIRDLCRRASRASSIADLLGYEGAAAARYFSRWGVLVASHVDPLFVSTWHGRVGRGATDPLNVALNFTYSLLLADVTRAVLACGLDPHAGFVHSSSRNKPALSLDLMEQFRPVVADSVVIGLVNNGELRSDMFMSALGDWRLSDVGRKTVIRGYERRVGQSFTHPTFGYRVTWRRAMEVQARMVLGVLDGSQQHYVGIRVR